MRVFLAALSALLFFLSCSKQIEKESDLLKSLESEKYATSNHSRKAYFLDSIFNRLDELPNSKNTREFTFKVSAQYYYLGKHRDSRKTSFLSVALCKKAGDSSNLARALYYIGDSYDTDKKDSAFFYYKQSENLYREMKDSERLAKVHYNKAHLLFYMGNFIDSEIEVLKALQNLDDEDNELLRYMCNSLLGSIHTEMDELDKALDYFKAAGQLLEKLAAKEQDSGDLYDYNVINTIDICNVYDKKGEFAKSIQSLERVATHRLEVEYPKLYSDVIGNLAYSMMKRGDYGPSEKHYRESLALARRLGYDQGILYRTINYGEYRLLRGDTIGAKALFEEALPLAKKLHSGKEVLHLLDFLATTDSNRAIRYKNEYVEIIDSLAKNQRASKEKFSRIEYETGKIQHANLSLIKKNIRLALFSTFLVLASLSIIFARHRIARKKEKALLWQKRLADDELLELMEDFQNKLAKAQATEQNRISKELHDGVVNQIYGIRMILGSLNDGENSRDKEERLRYIRDLQKVETEIRTLSHGLHSENEMKSTDFNIFLASLVKSHDSHSKTNFRCEISQSIVWEDYSSFVKINIYRILQELLTNVSKHAEAESCATEINMADEALLIIVRDNGAGFEASNRYDGIGLKNIRQRAGEISAKLIVETQNGKGALFSLQVPKK